MCPWAKLEGEGGIFHMAGDQVLEGRRHRYVVGPEIGRRVFRGEDEQGRPVAIKIGAKEALLGQAALARLLPEGVLPSLIEFSEMAGGRLGFIATEFVSGYSLKDILLEGRRLSEGEAVRLTHHLGRALQAFQDNGVALLAIPTEDVVFDTSRGRWRLMSAGQWTRTAADGAMARTLGLLVLDVMDAGGGDGRFTRSLRRAARGEAGLSHLTRTALALSREGHLLARLSAFLGLF